MSEWQELAAWDWVELGAFPTVLHHVAHLDDPAAARRDWCAQGSTSCHRTGALWLPGLFARSRKGGLPRCVRCCRETGMPLGTGSPKNTRECRPIVERELAAGAGRAGRDGRGVMLRIRVKMPDGSAWDVPAEYVAEQRATYYAYHDTGATSGPEWERVYHEERAYALSEDEELLDWAANNLNWSDVAHLAVMGEAPPERDYQEGWVNGKKWVVGRQPTPTAESEASHDR